MSTSFHIKWFIVLVIKYVLCITRSLIYPSLGIECREIMAKNYAFISSHNSVWIVCQVSYATFFVEFETHTYISLVQINYLYCLIGNYGSDILIYTLFPWIFKLSFIHIKLPWFPRNRSISINCFFNEW